MNEAMPAAPSQETRSEEEKEYEALKAEAEASAALIMQEVGCPSDPENLVGMDQAALVELETVLLEKINGLSVDEETGEVSNENRHIVKLLSGYARLAEVSATSQAETSMLLEKMPRVRF